MRRLFLSFIIILFSANLTFSSDAYETLKNKADIFYDEGSFATAYELYSKIKKLLIPEQDISWIEYRYADTLWRSQVCTSNYDVSLCEKSFRLLKEVIKNINKEDNNHVWALANESLGDYCWSRFDKRDFHSAWPYYEKALEYWKNYKDKDVSRKQYMNIVKKIAQPNWAQTEEKFYDQYSNLLPLEILNNIPKMAITNDDNAYAHFLIAMNLELTGDPNQETQIEKEFEEALRFGKSTKWYDDILYYYADWSAKSGKITELKSVGIHQEPDLTKALYLFRRLTKEFHRVETQYYDRAVEQIEKITKPYVEVKSPNVYLNNSNVQIHLLWRNVKKIDFILYKIDLFEDIKYFDKNTKIDSWQNYVSLEGKRKYKTWQKETLNLGDHKLKQEIINLDFNLPMGAYLLEAKVQDAVSREIILVSDISVITKSSNKKALIYCCNANDGSPVMDTKVKLWKKQDYTWFKWADVTDKDGLCVFDLKNAEKPGEIIVTAQNNDRQSFSVGYSSSIAEKSDEWLIFAYSDKNIYSPNEDVSWKVISRKMVGLDYSIPIDQIIKYRIIDSNGCVVKNGDLKLNAFGSAWDSFHLDESLPLGCYHINFSEGNRGRFIGGSELFRLKESKSPDIIVDVQIPEEDGKKKTFYFGEDIEIGIKTNYRMGGPASKVNVEVLVYENPFNIYDSKLKLFFDDDFRNKCSIIKRENLITDDNGKTSIKIKMINKNKDNSELLIVARITDSLGITSIDTKGIRVTRNAYFVYINKKHRIYNPNEKIKVNIETIDANNQPVSVVGTIKVIKKIWNEIWIDPYGKLVEGVELKNYRKSLKRFPPQPKNSKENYWKLKSHDYIKNEIIVKNIQTDENGKADFDFITPQEGYYTIQWHSLDVNENYIFNETEIWIGNNGTTDLAYKNKEVEIILDKDKYYSGDTLKALLNLSEYNKYVLLTVESDDIYYHKVVHIRGRSKLIKLPIMNFYSPNIYLNAQIIYDETSFSDGKYISIPPAGNFVNIDLKSDKNLYKPNETGTLIITTTDRNGMPVDSEISLSIVDDAIYNVSKTNTCDIKCFFYGDTKELSVQTYTTLDNRKFVKLKENADKKIIDERLDRKKSIFGITEVKEKEGKDKIISINEEVKLTEINSEYNKRLETSPHFVDKADMHLYPNIYWNANIRTGKDGKASIKVTFPDKLATWNALACAVGQRNKFGDGSYVMRTKKPLMVKIQTPTFINVGDEFAITGVISNNTDKLLKITPDLEVKGITLRQTGIKKLWIPARSELSATWMAFADKPERAIIKLKVLNENYYDCSEKSYDIYEHGMKKSSCFLKKIYKGDTEIKLLVPKNRRLNSTRLNIQLTPSIWMIILESLGDLIEYTYGCTEEIVSKSIPSYVAFKILKEKKYISEKSILDVFKMENIKSFEAFIDEHLKETYKFQKDNGGWSWWKNGEEDSYITAYIVWCLSIAKKYGMQIKDDVLNRGVDNLDKNILNENDIYLRVWMLFALTNYNRLSDNKKIIKFQEKVFQELWDKKESMNPHVQALLAICANNLDYDEKAKLLIQNLSKITTIEKLKNNETIFAHWQEKDPYPKWQNNEIESTAFMLQALIDIDQKNELIEPTVNWLINNGQSERCYNTKESAIVLLSLMKYMEKIKNCHLNSEYELYFNDKLVKNKKINEKNIIDLPDSFIVDQRYYESGFNKIKVKNKGSDILYLFARLEYYSNDEPIANYGKDINISRNYFTIAKKKTSENKYIYKRNIIKNKQEIFSGENIEEVIVIDLNSSYRYLVLEDPRPAGFDVTSIRSGQSLNIKKLKPEVVKQVLRGNNSDKDLDNYTGESRLIYQELSDNKTVFFISDLTDGYWEIRYKLRADIPGDFHGLPALIYGRYLPQVYSNSEEFRVKIIDSRK